jgi:hypothetical protein
LVNVFLKRRQRALGLTTKLAVACVRDVQEQDGGSRMEILDNKNMEMELVLRCNICQSDSIQRVDPSYNFCRCSACGYVFNSPRPTHEAIAAFYSKPAKYVPGSGKRKPATPSGGGVSKRCLETVPRVVFSTWARA